MRLHAVVRGRVQGVGFRWFVRETATRLGLAGRVLNRADGAVEVEAEGDEAAIAALRRELAAGPRGANVEAVDELQATAETLARPFSIER